MDISLQEENRKSWNAATHNRHLNLAECGMFFRNGGNTLLPEERELLGDVANQDIVHLLCNDGQDTLSIAQLGANATGVDISDEAINLAQQLSEISGIPATFYRSEVLEWLANIIKEQVRFDQAYCSYGVIRWIANINTWAKGVFAILRAGGRLVIIDFHPLATMFNRDWQRIYPYRTGGETSKLKSGVGTSIQLSQDDPIPFPYDTGDTSFCNSAPAYHFHWGLGEVVTALAVAGFSITTLNEYPYARYWHFEFMQDLQDKRKIPPPHVPAFPLLFGIVAIKAVQ
jgi:SAM-dependent methyltransferase